MANEPQQLAPMQDRATTKHQIAWRRSGPNWRLCRKPASTLTGAPPGTTRTRLDSLFLTQAAAASRPVSTPPSAFVGMGELATVDAVAGHLDRVAENFAVDATPAARSQIEASPATHLQAAIPTPGFAAVAGPGQGIEQVMAAQLASMTDLINRQLETLRQIGGAAPLAAAAAPAVRQPSQAAAPLQTKPLPEKHPARRLAPSSPSRERAMPVSTPGNAVLSPI